MRTARAADVLGGVGVIDRDRLTLGVNVVHKAQWFASSKRCDIVSRLDPDYQKKRNEKSSFRVLGWSCVDAFGLRF